MNLIALIISISVLIGMVYYNIKYKKPFINYDDDIYDKMVSIRFYFILVVVIILLAFLQFKSN